MSLQYNRRGQPFIILDPGGRPQVMLPKENIRWLMDQPDAVLSERAVQHEKFALKYLIPPMDYHQENSMVLAIRRELTRNLGKTQAGVFDTMRETIDATMGVDDASWQQICLFQTMQKVVFKATNRILVGSPLCNDEKYLDSLGQFSTWLGAGAVIIGQYVPWFLAPLLGYLASIPVNIYRRKSLRFLVPVIEDRIENTQRKKTDPSYEYDEPKDLITWTVAAANRSTAVEVADMIFFLVSQFRC